MSKLSELATNTHRLSWPCNCVICRGANDQLPNEYRDDYKEASSPAVMSYYNGAATVTHSVVAL